VGVGWLKTELCPLTIGHLGLQGSEQQVIQSSLLSACIDLVSLPRAAQSGTLEYAILAHSSGPILIGRAQGHLSLRVYERQGQSIICTPLPDFGAKLAPRKSMDPRT